MRLVSLGPGHYKSDDGRVEVFHDDTYETECDGPHPMRVRMDYPGVERHIRLGATVKNGRVVWMCEGNDVHYYSMWTVRIDGDWTDDVYEKFEGALGVIERKYALTGEKVTVVRGGRHD